MKRFAVFAVLMAVGSGAMAQILAVGQTAGRTDAGAISLGAGVSVWIDEPVDSTIAGGRCSYGVLPNVLLIGDVAAVVGPDDETVGLGAAVQYTLPVDLFLDLAFRLGYGTWDVDNASDNGTINAMLLTGTRVESVDNLALYAGLGAMYSLGDAAAGDAVVEPAGAGPDSPAAKVSGSEAGSDGSDDWKVVGCLGVTYGLGNIVENLSAYGEVDYVSDDVGLCISLGAVYGF
ncbi:MAG: hypothetical protein WCL44_03750 [bacterium]